MFDKLEDILIRLDEIINELAEPNVANDTNRFQKLMKEQSDLQPIADAYREYKDCQQTVEDRRIAVPQLFPYESVLHGAAPQISL